MSGPLNGIRIVDFSNMLMAPYASQILGDMGADVIKVEAPEGDPVRGVGPARHAGMGAIYLNVNRSKRSLVLDLKQKDGQAVMLDLLRGADVLLYNRRPRVMERLGLGYDAVSAANPRLIYAGLYGYGQNGPYGPKPAFDDLIQGAVAIPWLSHKADGHEPRYVPTAIVDRGVALWAVGQINAALLHQSRTGQGQRIDIPMFEMMASFVLADHMAGQTFDPPIGPMGYGRMLTPDRRPYPTKDGYLCVMIYTDRHWRAFYAALGREKEFENDPRMASMATRSASIGEIYKELGEVLTTRTNAEWQKLFDDADIPAMPLQDLEQLLADRHLAATGFFTFTEHPTEGRLRQIGMPGAWSKSPPRPGRHAPRLGENSVEVLQELGYASDRIEKLISAGVTATPPDAK